jgi:hypothetical protein
VFEPKSAIYLAAAKVAEDPVPDIAGIEISTASPQYLLAMKLMAMRFGEDDEDIEILLRECGLHSAQEALDLLEHMYPHQEPPPKTRFFLEELFGSMSPP